MPDFTEARPSDLDPIVMSWFVHVLETIETLVPADYTALMTDDVTLRLPDGTHLEGRAAVRAAFEASWPSLSSLVHNERAVHGDAHQVVHEARVVTTLQNGTVSVADSTSWIDRAPDGRISAARVYG